jgi:signal transduction histidine kinase
MSSIALLLSGRVPGPGVVPAKRPYVRTAPMQIAVTDQGPGVSAEFRERVFERFFRVKH